jgi:hypothetical protein
MDNPMAEIVGRESVGLADRYGVRVFSRNNWDEFLAWLKDLKGSMSAEHKEGVRVAYSGPNSGVGDV